MIKLHRPDIKIEDERVKHHLIYSSSRINALQQINESLKVLHSALADTGATESALAHVVEVGTVVEDAIQESMQEQVVILHHEYPILEKFTFGLEVKSDSAMKEFELTVVHIKEMKGHVDH